MIFLRLVSSLRHTHTHTHLPDITELRWCRFYCFCFAARRASLQLPKLKTMNCINEEGTIDLCKHLFTNIFLVIVIFVVFCRCYNCRRDCLHRHCHHNHPDCTEPSRGHWFTAAVVANWRKIRFRSLGFASNAFFARYWCEMGLQLPIKRTIAILTREDFLCLCLYPCLLSLSTDIQANARIWARAVLQKTHKNVKKANNEWWMYQPMDRWTNGPTVKAS